MITGRLDKIDSVTTSFDGSNVLIGSDEIVVRMAETEIQIKLGESSVKVSTFEFMKAFRDMLETGEFQLDQMDSFVWGIEKQADEAREKYEAIRDYEDSRGFYGRLL